MFWKKVKDKEQKEKEKRREQETDFMGGTQKHLKWEDFCTSQPFEEWRVK